MFFSHAIHFHLNWIWEYNNGCDTGRYCSQYNDDAQRGREDEVLNALRIVVFILVIELDTFFI